jgi:kynurenine formamidase
MHTNLHVELRSHFLYNAKSIQTILSTFIIYCIGISIFPIVYVLGLYN